MSLNLFLWQHLKISSLHLSNSWLVNWHQMMLIFLSRQRLHLLLKLLGVEDFSINLQSICRVKPLFLQLQNLFRRAVWFLRKGLKKFVLYEISKSIYWLAYIEYSWRFIRILWHILKLIHSQLIFFGYYIYMGRERLTDRCMCLYM